MLKTPQNFLAFGFGAGLSPYAPGTTGTLVALPLIWFMSLLPGLAYFVITLFCFVSGIYICDQASRDLGVHDHGGIVWDEIAGMMITMLLVPVSVTSMFTGFILFRFFDILKPWPIRCLDQKVQGGWGIMLDDLVAGIFSAILLWLLVSG